MLRIILVGLAIMLAMIAIKDDRLLERAGLVHSCHAVAPPPGDNGAWRACEPGKLAGAPDLTRESCTRGAVVGRIEYWRCPAPVAPTVVR